ncbi:MAG: hypothetical protein K1X47_00490 [Cyclobacteriaceae bacterium]|nr:hypothetical protein [Cyclobacteriaceae bacterium]
MHSIDDLRLELSVKARNGLDFITAALIVWTAIAFVWRLPLSAYDRAVITFIVGGPMILLARLFSRILGTTWTVPDNPLQPLGLWLNFAQLFYFPILIFVLIRQPDYFVLVYVIITAAHFFPYAWYYRVRAYAIMAGVASVGSMFVALITSQEQLFLIPAFMAVCLLILAVWLQVVWRRNVEVYSSKR